jgi:uncharacterized protein (DUF885 family)
LDSSQSASLCETYEEKLLSFDQDELSLENQITRDSLLLYFHTQQELLKTPLLYEPLGPSLGIQAQLPVLLAEYNFYEEQDIIDYLKLLTTIRPYFESIFEFEKAKSEDGYFMSDATLDGILEQCAAFIEDPDSNYMLDIFNEKIQNFDGLSGEEIAGLCARHKELVLSEVIPAYEELMENLKTLRSTGKESCGLAAYPGGQDYYLALIQSETGSYQSIADIEERLTKQLSEDSNSIRLMLKEQSSLVSKLIDPTLLEDLDPEEVLAELSVQIGEDFPKLEDVTPIVRTVPSSMEDYLSPAFYLTPPIDTGEPNVIYINPASGASGLELYTTLAHEGFPGHLLQTVTFARENAPAVRYLFTSGGYTEGWATYVESWAADNAASRIDDPAAADIATLYWKNRSVNLCLYSLLDLGIHYHGWSEEDTSRFLASFGIDDTDTIGRIYQYIVETPGNYLKYYLGCLEFQDLRDEQKEKQGTAFSLKDFHQKVLSIGPVPFPVLEKYIDQ